MDEIICISYNFWNGSERDRDRERESNWVDSEGGSPRKKNVKLKIFHFFD